MAARMLLKKRGLDFRDIDVGKEPALREEMERRSGKRTVPQIFIDEQPIGGFDELHQMDQSGALDHLLRAKDSINEN